MAGEPLVRRDGTDGKRWYLDTAGVHCGDILKLAMADGSWLSVRFEIEHARMQVNDDGEVKLVPGPVPMIHLAAQGADPSVKVTDNMRFRWPEREASR